MASAAASAASAAGGASAVNMNEQEVMSVFKGLLGQKESFISKIAELEVELGEYRRVAETLKPLDGARRCHQLINSVLVESTVAEARPVVEANRDSLESVLRSMNERLSKLVVEIREFQARYNVRVLGPGEAEAMRAKQQAAAAAQQAAAVAAAAAAAAQ